MLTVVIIAAGAVVRTMFDVAITTRPARTQSLGRSADGRELPSRRRRLAPLIRLSDPVAGWVGPIAITLIAFGLRVWNLGRPDSFAFDETYYAKDAYSLLEHGYTTTYVDGADDRILAGNLTNIFGDEPSKVVHPEVGKYMIAAGEWLFGMDPTGWRISSAVFGSLTILVLIRLVRRMTGSTLMGCIAGVLLTFDGLSFVMSRLALLDLFLTFWLVCAVACLVADRDWGRLRLARAASSAPTRMDGYGPLLLFRPWRIGAGICFGLACGTKWNAVFALAAFGLLMWAWDSGARRTFGVRHPTFKAFIVDTIPSAFTLLLVAFVVYVLTWTDFLIHASIYEATFGSTWGTYWQHDATGFVPELTQSLRSLWQYHIEVWNFHTGVPDANGWSINNQTHPYMSNPGGWPILNRPVGVDAQLDIQPGQQGCTAAAGSTCLRQVLLLGTPALWWGGVVALVASFAFWLGQRDWRFGVGLVGYMSMWLPWFRYDDRPIFSYYAVAMVPFMVIALTLVIGKILGPPEATHYRRLVGSAVCGAFVLLVLVNFAWFYPVYADSLITHSEWLQRIWFATWI
jgi:dolichyl-phosphate-mannose-protein mannosyltransferase